MDRQEILDLYDWDDGVCFRHPSVGIVDTTVVKTLQPRGDGEHQVRACRQCVIAIEDMKREAARRSGREYEPGQAGKTSGCGEPAAPGSCEG